MEFCESPKSQYSTSGISWFIYDKNDASTGVPWYKSMHGSDYVAPTTDGYTIKAPNSNWISYK